MYYSTIPNEFTIDTEIFNRNTSVRISEGVPYSEKGFVISGNGYTLPGQKYSYTNNYFTNSQGS